MSSVCGWVSPLLISSEPRASGMPQEAVGEVKGPEAALRSMKNGKAGEILKVSVTLWKLPSNASYRVYPDTWHNPGDIILWLHTPNKSMHFSL